MTDDYSTGESPDPDTEPDTGIDTEPSTETIPIHDTGIDSEIDWYHSWYYALPPYALSHFVSFATVGRHWVVLDDTG